jgi:hypothetical protein
MARFFCLLNLVVHPLFDIDLLQIIGLAKTHKTDFALDDVQDCFSAYLISESILHHT